MKAFYLDGGDSQEIVSEIVAQIGAYINVKLHENMTKWL